MSVKLVKDNTIPGSWKRLQSENHKYIVIQNCNTKKTYYEVFHCDDCTLNNREYLFDVKGNLEVVKLSIGHYETDQKHIERTTDLLNNQF